MNYSTVGVIVTVSTGFQMSISKATDFNPASGFIYISFASFVSQFTSAARTFGDVGTTGFAVCAATFDFSY
jgi:hypothetical protein